MWVEFVVGISALLRDLFLRILQFSHLLKNQHFQIPIQSEWSLLLRACRVLLHVYFIIIIVALLNQSIKGNLINKEASLEKSAHF